MGDATPHSDDQPDRIVVFGRFRLLADRHMLLDADTPVSIGSRALAILIALTDRPGEVVTRDELVACAWPHLVVDESNLRAQVALLRKALRERESDFPFIAAVPGRGYRFVAPVSRTAPARRRREAHHNLPVRLERPIGRDIAIGAVKGRFDRYQIVTIGCEQHSTGGDNSVRDRRSSLSARGGWRFIGAGCYTQQCCIMVPCFKMSKATVQRLQDRVAMSGSAP